AIKEKAGSARSLGIATAQNTMGQVYRAEGKYAEAEQLFKAALTFREQESGSNHLDLAETLADLALVYQAQHRYDETEPLLVRAVAMHREVEGPSNPATAKAINQLAMLSALAGKTAQALSYSRQATATVIALAANASTDAQQNTASLNLIEQRASFFRT